MLKVANVKMNIHVKEEDYKKVLSSHLNIRHKEITNVKLIKRSIDARKADVFYICTFAFDVLNEANVLKQCKQVSKYEPFVLEIPPKIDEKVPKLPCFSSNVTTLRT